MKGAPARKRSVMSKTKSLAARQELNGTGMSLTQHKTPVDVRHIEDRQVESSSQEDSESSPHLPRQHKGTTDNPFLYSIDIVLIGRRR